MPGFALSWSLSPQPVAPWTSYHQMHGAAVLNGYLYVIGGTTATGVPPQGSAGAVGDSFSVYRAQITSPGAISAWTTCTASLPAGATYTSDPEYAYINRHVFTYNGRIYITGGNTNRSGAVPERNGVTFATPGLDGNISSWAYQPAIGNSIARFEHTGVVDPASGRIYIIGGGGAIPRSKQIDFASTNADGTLNTFNTAGQLAVGVGQAPAVIRAGKLYVFGGNVGGSATSLVQHADILIGGSLGTFTTSDAVLPENRFDGAAILAGGEVYVIGGAVSNDNDTRNSVYRAVFDSSGTITSWVTDSSFPASPGLRRMTAATDGSAIYIPGGKQSSSSITPDVWVSVVEPGSAVKEWQKY
jgi:hypothetical protein